MGIIVKFSVYSNLRKILDNIAACIKEVSNTSVFIALLKKRNRRVAKVKSIIIVRLNFKGAVAQWLEQTTHNRLVVGSSPTGPTKISTTV